VLTTTVVFAVYPDNAPAVASAAIALHGPCGQGLVERLAGAGDPAFVLVVAAQFALGAELAGRVEQLRRRLVRFADVPSEAVVFYSTA
jgi:hypothetical protein